MYKLTIFSDFLIMRVNSWPINKQSLCELRVSAKTRRDKSGNCTNTQERTEEKDDLLVLRMASLSGEFVPAIYFHSQFCLWSISRGQSESFLHFLLDWKWLYSGLLKLFLFSLFQINNTISLLHMSRLAWRRFFFYPKFSLECFKQTIDCLHRENLCHCGVVCHSLKIRENHKKS